MDSEREKDREAVKLLRQHEAKVYILETRTRPEGALDIVKTLTSEKAKTRCLKRLFFSLERLEMWDP